jgi:hypothetical protein
MTDEPFELLPTRDDEPAPAELDVPAGPATQLALDVVAIVAGACRG